MTELLHELLIDWPGRALPSSLLILAGLGFSTFGVATLGRALRISVWHADRNIVWMRGFRVAIVGLAIAGVGTAWLTQQFWVLLIALAIGGEELLETSVLLYTLRRGRRIQPSSARTQP